MTELAAEGGIERLVEAASFIFVGKVSARGRSSVRDLTPRPELVVAELERQLRVDPVLGDLTGRPITVLPAPGADVAVGSRLIFFANSWVHAEEIAVAAVANTVADDKTEELVRKAVDDLPRRRLAARVAQARLIVHAVVGSVERVTDVPEPVSEHRPDWHRARLRVQQVMKGEARRGQARAVSAYFPGSDDVAFRDVPKLRAGEEAVYLLHDPPPRLPAEVYVLPDPLDVHPVGRKGEVARLAADLEPPTPR
jgi:hypothetical protein